MNEAKCTFFCHKISEGKVEGPVLISQDEILFYLCDPETGQVIEEGHDLEGQSVAGKILVFPAGKGSSSVQVDGLYQLLTRNNAPKGMIIQRPDTILVTSAIIMEIPLVDRVEDEFYRNVENGDYLFLDADSGKIIIKKQEKTVEKGNCL
jgi:predicted aconitase with swiveling domain